MRANISNLQKNYSRDSWIDPRLELRESPIQGKGVFAKSPIKKGETVIVWGGVVMTGEDLKAGKAAKHTVAAIGEGLYLAEPAGESDEKDALNIDDYMNHSCDPNVWMRDAVTLVARRNIKVGEELTADYAMWSVDPNWKMECNCGSPLCRGTITGDDWKLEGLQKRYERHFSPFINKRIKRLFRNKNKF